MAQSDWIPLVSGVSEEEIKKEAERLYPNDKESQRFFLSVWAGHGGNPKCKHFNVIELFFWEGLKCQDCSKQWI